MILDKAKNFTVALFTEDPNVILGSRAVVTILDNDSALNLLIIQRAMFISSIIRCDSFCSCNVNCI